MAEANKNINFYNHSINVFSMTAASITPFHYNSRSKKFSAPQDVS